MIYSRKGWAAQMTLSDPTFPPCKAMKITRTFFILFFVVPFIGCPQQFTPEAAAISHKEISRARAIEIARAQVKFQPKSITAKKVKEKGRPVWRVTFRGEPPGQGNVMGEILIISLDRFTGKIVSIAQS